MKIQMRFNPTEVKHDYGNVFSAVEGRFSPIGTKFCGGAMWTGPGLFALPLNMARTMFYAREWTVTVEADTTEESRERLAREVATNATPEQLDAIAKIMDGG